MEMAANNREILLHVFTSAVSFDERSNYFIDFFFFFAVVVAEKML